MKLKGSVTIFLSLILLIVIGIIGSLLEAARVKVAEEITLDNGYLAESNILAEYQRELWDDYHVFFVDAGELQGDIGIERLGNKYIEKMIDDGEGENKNFMGAEAKFDYLNFTESMTEESCTYFVKQVAAYMKYGAAKASAELVLGDTDALKKYEKGAEALRKVIKVKTEVENKLIKLSKTKQKIEEKLYGVQEKLEDIRRLTEKAGSIKDVGDISKFKGDLNNLIYKIKEEKNGLNTEFLNYDNEKEKSLDAVNEYKDELEKNRNELQKENYEYLKKNMEEGMGGNEDIKRKLENNERRLNNLLEISEREDSKISDIEKAVKEIDFDIKKGKKKNTKKIDKAIKKYKKETETAISGNGNIILSALTEGKISGKKIKATDWNEFEERGESVESGGVDKVLLLLYAKTHFKDYLTNKAEKEKGGTADGMKNGKKEKPEALDYGIEYLVIGKDSDEANLTGVLERIFGIRTMIQYSYLITKEDKVAEAKAIAASIAGALGIPSAAAAIETGILMSWAMADAKKDVNLLTRGEEIPLHPSTESLKAGYRKYLYMFLLAASGKLPIRTVKLIEQNIKLRYNENFKADNCFSGVSGEITLKVRPKIFRMKFLDGIAGENFGGWKYSLQLNKSLGME